MLYEPSRAFVFDCQGAFSPPAGGFYLFPDSTPLRERLALRGITTNRELCERLLEDTGVAILPGADFGRPLSELTARITWVISTEKTC